MKTKEEIISEIEQQGILPLYFYEELSVTLEILRTLYHSGIRVVEFTNRGEAALENFKKLREVSHKEMYDMRLGIGTVKNGETARNYIEAGADFIVSPGLVEEVGKLADEHNLLWIPGCMSPSEIIRAENLGAKLIKLFPGDMLGAEFVRAVKPLFPGLKFMPTGGVTLDEENLRKWFLSGVVAVGMGSKLISKELLESKNYETIGRLTREVLRLIKNIKQ